MADDVRLTRSKRFGFPVRFCIGLLLISLVISSVFLAGCVFQPDADKNVTAPVYISIPQDMVRALDMCARDFMYVDKSIESDGFNLAMALRAAADHQGIINQLAAYYAAHSYLEGVLYYDNLTSQWIEYPEVSVQDKRLASSIPTLTESDFSLTSLQIYYDAIDVEGEGCCNILYTPVYDVNGKYCGYLAFFWQVVFFSLTLIKM